MSHLVNLSSEKWATLIHFTAIVYEIELSINADKLALVVWYTTSYIPDLEKIEIARTKFMGNGSTKKLVSITSHPPDSKKQTQIYKKYRNQLTSNDEITLEISVCNFTAILYKGNELNYPRLRREAPICCGVMSPSRARYQRQYMGGMH